MRAPRDDEVSWAKRYWYRIAVGFRILAPNRPRGMKRRAFSCEEGMRSAAPSPLAVSAYTRDARAALAALFIRHKMRSSEFGEVCAFGVWLLMNIYTCWDLSTFLN